MLEFKAIYREKLTTAEAIAAQVEVAHPVDRDLLDLARQILRREEKL